MCNNVLTSVIELLYIAARANNKGAEQTLQIVQAGLPFVVHTRFSRVEAYMCLSIWLHLAIRGALYLNCQPGTVSKLKCGHILV